MLEPLAKTIKTAIFDKRYTTEFPENREPLPDSYRGRLRLDMETCISCSACAIICPNQTITMVSTLTEKGDKIMPQVGHERCLFCALCAEVCPPKCLTLTKSYDYEAYDKRELLTRPEELE
ncbi:MAG: 4Fe-4S dicluster domain-containing protein [Candidatus Marsarchaeota archaeon]|nr:4Fe-4S dicluster domain-containing protein [Candidatus Marsarchaeota archaeon]MCL5412852.1 4Fe-4S dicluster domain-containing protein [Candidatus Marsarchaeota archaeon]